MEKSFPLDELIDREELQSIQDGFARAAGISSVFLSPEGKTLTKFTNPTGFCSLIQSTKKGKERCIRSFMEMGKTALGSEEQKIFYCFAHCGNFVAPIMIDGDHKGTMFAGQFIPEKFSPEKLRDLEEIAHKIDLDPKLLVKKAEQMHVVGEDVIRNYSSLLFKVVEIIARRGTQAAKLIRAKDALQRAHDEPENRVRKRSAELAEANRGLKHKIAERKLVDGALQKERDKAQHYLDIAGVMFLVIGADRKVSLINRKGCEILGYGKEEEITGKDWFDNFVPERLRDEVARIFGLLIAGKIKPAEYYENPVLTKHGEERIVAWHNTILKDERGRIYATLASGEDITERVRAEDALRESEEKYRTLYDSSSAAIMLLDEKGFFDCNEVTLRLFGCVNREEFCCRHPADFSPPTQPDGTDSMSYARNNIAVALKEGSKRFEHLHRRLDGTDFPAEVLLDALMLGDRKVLQARVYDITERKAAQETIKKSEERYKTLFEFAMDGILIADIETKKLEYANPAICKMLGYSAEELKRMSISNIHPKDKLEYVISEFEAQARGEKTLALDIPCLRKDGTIIYADINTTVGLVDGKKCNTGFFRDITERKRVEKALNDRVELEKIIASISTSFINLAPDEIDIEIDNALKNIGEFAGIDRSYFFRLFDNGTKVENTHEWCAEGIVPQIKNLKGLSVAGFPWFYERLNRFEVVHIPKVADLPPEAKAEKEELESENILSVILVPMVYSRTLLGFIGFDSVRQTKIWPENDIALLKIAGEIFVNALERKRVIDIISDSEEKYRLLADNTADCIWQMDLNFEFTYTNSSVLQMFGFTQDEWIGSSLSEHCLPEGMELVAALVMEFLKTGLDPGTKIFEMQLFHKNGKVVTAEITGKILFDENGNPVGFQGTTRDVTERKAAEEEIKKKTDELEKFNKLAVGRELKMIKLKKEINALLEKSGKEPRYKIVGEPQAEVF